MINDDGTTTTTPEGLAITDWGDGTIDNELSHTYNEPGTYIVKTTLQPNNISTEEYNKLIKKVINVRNDISNFRKFCYGCTNMEQFSIDNIIHPANMAYMFSSCESLTLLDLSNFDTSNVTNMTYMFSDCGSLTSLDLSNFDTSNVTDMHCMFSCCESLISLNISNFDTSNVTDMRWMFWHCESLTSLNLFNFNANNLKYISQIFNYCKKLLNINFEITNNLIYGYHGFINNSGINYIHIKGTLTDNNLSEFINNLPTMPQSNIGTLDTSNLSNQSVNLILSNSSILDSTHAKNWKFSCEN